MERASRTGHDGWLEASVLEGVAGIAWLLLLGGRELPIHFLQRVVDVGPIQVPAPLCSGAQEQGRVHHQAYQQKENQGQGEGQPRGPGGGRETPNGGVGGMFLSPLTVLLHPEQAQGRGLQGPHSTVEKQTGLAGPGHDGEEWGQWLCGTQPVLPHLLTFQEKP